MQKQINNTALRTILALTLSCSSALLTAGCGGSGGGYVAPPTGNATTVTREAALSTGQEVSPPALILPDPATANPGGKASFTLYSTNRIKGSLTLSGFTSPLTAITGAHIHDGDAGSSGGIIVHLTSTDNVVWNVLPADKVLSDAQVARFKAGGHYANVHTTTNGAGLMRGQLISFADNIQTIFTANCIGCHTAGGSAPMSLVAGASIADLVGVSSTFSTPNGTRVKVNDSANSILYKRISGLTVGPQMPLSKPPLGANDQNLIKVWIDMGAVNN